VYENENTLHVSHDFMALIDSTSTHRRQINHITTHTRNSFEIIDSVFSRSFGGSLNNLKVLARKIHLTSSDLDKIQLCKKVMFDLAV
jgi:hypothetical protein